MPITVQQQGIDRFLIQMDRKLNSPDLAIQLAQDLSSKLVASAPVETGATKAALSKIGEPQRTATGWTIGVGDKEQTGSEGESAPRGTLRAFFDYLAASGLPVRPSNWWGLSSDNKALLLQGRRTGKFGGRGAMYANYMWIQNRGNAIAGIRGTMFIDRAILEWRANVPNVIRGYFAQAS